MNTTIRAFKAGDEHTCEAILRALPEWFGIESSLVQYVESTTQFPTWLAESSGSASGFITIHRHFPQSAEIHVIGVHPAHHRTGIGRRLVTFAEDDLRRDECLFLQVKTLDESRPSAAYAMTRKFYRAMGFVPVKAFPTLWPGNPALMLIKSL